MNVHARIPERHDTGMASRPSIKALADQLGYSPDWHWSWANYKAMILAMAQAYDLRDHLEIGGGRDPLFTAEETERFGFDVTLNDIAQGELDRAPPGFATLCCDIASPSTVGVVGRQRFDFAYCRMVMEHVPDVPQMWRNVYEVLAPGGAALSFFPTLFAPPFTLNQLVPEAASRAVLHALFPDRRDEGDNPKFPAHYNCCRGSEAALVPLLTDLGFREIVVLPFYGYSYFWKIPGLKQVDAAFTRLAQARDWRLFTSFAFVIARK